MKKIAIIATGGTISALGADRLDFTNYKTGSLSIEEIVSELPELEEMAEIETYQYKNFSSCDLTAEDWLNLKDVVENYLNVRHFDGVIITHGTSTIEETAYFLHLTINSSKPIICTGSQRPFNALGTDAAVNLLNAVKVAKDDQSHGKGVLVVLNDAISSAREVTKVDTYRLEGFQSGHFGFLGFVEADGTVQYYREPTRIHTIHSQFAQKDLLATPDVEIVYSYAGAKGTMIRALIAEKTVKGIVIAGTGAGKFSTEEKHALSEAVEKGIVVVRSSRLGNGRVIPLREYDGYGFIAGDHLLPQKARILLMLALSITTDINVIQHIFNKY